MGHLQSQFPIWARLKGVATVLRGPSMSVYKGVTMVHKDYQLQLVPPPRGLQPETAPLKRPSDQLVPFPNDVVTRHNEAVGAEVARTPT